MDIDAYDKEFLIQKFPHLAMQIETGFFKIVLEGEGNAARKVIRFANTAVFRPDHKFIIQLVDQLYGYPRPETVVFESYGLVGMQIRLV